MDRRSSTDYIKNIRERLLSVTEKSQGELTMKTTPVRKTSHPTVAAPQRPSEINFGDMDEEALKAYQRDLESNLDDIKLELRSRRSADMIPVGTKVHPTKGKYANMAGTIIVPGRTRCLVQFNGTIKPVMLQVKNLRVDSHGSKRPS